MADIVNLRRFRKAKARAEKETAADENRARHGRTKAEKDRVAETEAKNSRDWAGHRIENTGDPDDNGA